MKSFGMMIGPVTVETSSNGGHSLEFYAETLTNRIISVSSTAPDPIKAQALQYKESLRGLILDTLKRVVISDRNYRQE
jgi:hypothetical protein